VQFSFNIHHVPKSVAMASLLVHSAIHLCRTSHHRIEDEEVSKKTKIHECLIHTDFNKTYTGK